MSAFIMQTSDGVVWDLNTDAPQRITPHTLARVLSRIPRYVGHTFTPYSVAEHSLLVQYLAVSLAMARQLPIAREVRLAAVIHDAHEAITGDIPSPVKRMLEAMAGSPVIRELQDRVQRSMAGWLMWPTFSPEVLMIVAEADRLALTVERKALIGPELVPWGIEWPADLALWHSPLAPRIADPASAWLEAYTAAVEAMHEQKAPSP